MLDEALFDLGQPPAPPLAPAERAAVRYPRVIVPIPAPSPTHDDDQPQPACRDAYDPDLWHPEGWGLAFRSTIAAAKAICRSCPVRSDCLEAQLTYEGSMSIKRRQDLGIWGGLDPSERYAAYHATRRTHPATDPDPA